MRRRSDSAGITLALGAASGVTTSIVTISGAAARTASSTVSSRVTADDGQLLQLPANSRRTTSSTTPSSLTSPPCDPIYGLTLSRASSMRRSTSCGCNPCTNNKLATRSSATNEFTKAGSAATAIRNMRSRPAPYRSVTSPTSRSARSRATVPPTALASSNVCIRSPAVRHCASSPGSSGRAAIGYSPVTDWVGECNRSKVFPLPRYMCTPHGRHGSKLRTVRMMSMPLKCSRSFSSKIG